MNTGTVDHEAKLERLKEFGPDENTMRIMLASDVHLGYGELDPIRHKDSFNAFEEVLQLANETHADMIILGGDLFHESRPTRSCMLQCIRLLRKHTYGHRPSRLHYKSDASRDFSHSHFPTPNYLDPHCNVKMPVFSVSGNHDDITGTDNLSALDELQESKLINYFGKVVKLDKIEISPVILSVGDTSLALYGLNSLKDERLHRCFKSNDVKFLRLEGDTDGTSQFFNMFVVHQNRVVRGSTTNYIPQDMLPGFLDFILWGHEHDAQPEPVKFGVADDETYILQPGSTVATSLAQGEAGPKYCFLMELNGRKTKVCQIKLKTTRQLAFKSISFEEMGLEPKKLDIAQTVEQFCMSEVNAMVEECREERQRENNPLRPQLPLIRLRVDYTDAYHSFKKPIESRFCQRFENLVANPRDIFKFSKKNTTRTRRAVINADAMNEAMQNNKQQLQRTVEMIVKDYFDRFEPESREHMQVLSEGFMRVAVTHCVNKGEKQAPGMFINTQTNKMRQQLKKEFGQSEDEIDSKDVEEAIYELKVKRLQRNKDTQDTINQEIEEAELEAQSFVVQNGNENDADMLDVSGEDDIKQEDTTSRQAVPASGRGRGRGRGRGAKATGETGTKTSGRGRARGAKAANTTNGATGQSSLLDSFQVGAKRSRQDSSPAVQHKGNSDTASTALAPRSKRPSRNSTVGASYLDSDTD